MRLSASRADVLRPLLAAAVASIVPARDPAAAIAAAPPAVITDRAYLDLRIIQSFDVEVLEDASVRGRLTLGLFGQDAPLGVARFLEFVKGTVGQYAATGGGPAYSGSAFTVLKPGVLLEGGKITGLKQTEFAGSLEWEYMSRLLPSLRPIQSLSQAITTDR